MAYNFSVRRGDTYTGCSFELLQYTDVSVLPDTGVSGIIYRLAPDGLLYKWDGSEFVVTTDKNPVNLIGSSIRMEIKKTEFDIPAQVLTELSGLTITDGANGIFEINQQVFLLPIDSYQFEIIITLASGVIKTYIDGSMGVY